MGLIRQIMIGIAKKNRDWDNVNQKWIKGKISYGLFLNPKTLKFLKFKKSRQEFICYDCGKKFPKGTRLIYKDRWDTICLGCAVKMFSAMVEQVDEFRELIKQPLKDYEKNKTKWDRELMLSLLKYG